MLWAWHSSAPACPTDSDQQIKINRSRSTNQDQHIKINKSRWTSQDKQDQSRKWPSWVFLCLIFWIRTKNLVKKKIYLNVYLWWAAQEVTMSLSSFFRCLYPHFYFEALKANFYVLMLVVFHKCLLSVLFYQWFTSFSLEFHQCFTSVSPVFHKCYNSVSKSVKIQGVSKKRGIRRLVL